MTYTILQRYALYNKEIQKAIRSIVYNDTKTFVFTCNGIHSWWCAVLQKHEQCYRFIQTSAMQHREEHTQQAR